MTRHGGRALQTSGWRGPRARHGGLGGPGAGGGGVAEHCMLMQSNYFEQELVSPCTLCTEQ